MVIVAGRKEEESVFMPFSSRKGGGVDDACLDLQKGAVRAVSSGGAFVPRVVGRGGGGICFRPSGGGGGELVYCGDGRWVGGGGGLFAYPLRGNERVPAL